MHGGVRPWWQQGSSETYIVAPAGSSVQAASASRSACGSPGALWKPSPIASPSLTTHGADERVRARVATRPLGELDGSHEEQLVLAGGGRVSH